MTVPLPSVDLTVVDGTLGSTSPSAANTCLVMGVCSGGTALAPELLATTDAAVSGYGYGPAVEAAAYILQETGVPVLFCRLEEATAGSVDLDTAGITGTSVLTITGTPLDSYEGLFEVPVGGTIGTAGIKIRYSLDNGRTWHGPYALGTATTFPLPNTGLTLNFAAGTLVADDAATFACVEPASDAAGIQAGFAAVHASDHQYGFALYVGQADASLISTIDGDMSGAIAGARWVSTLVNLRGYDAGEDDATYKASVASALAATTSTRVGAMAGHATITSPISGRQYLRPGVWAAAARGVKNRPAEDLAKVKNGPLPRVYIKDAKRQLIAGCRDERTSPGLNAERLMTLCTIVGKRGVFIGNPNLLAPVGSDFDLWQYRRVMDIACTTTYQVLVEELSNDVRLARTGFILEKDALAIESRVNSALDLALLVTGNASEAKFVLSRTDNLSSTKTATGEVRVIPLGYLKRFAVSLGYTNPALSLVTT